MKKFLSALCATALTASFAITGALPANAAPIYVPKAPTVEHSDVVKVQDFRWKRRGGRDGPRFGNRRNFSNNWDGPRRIYRGSRRNWDGPRRIDRRYGWYHGHRGYRDYRRGYRYY